MASYLEWNRSIVSTLFPVSESDAPIYLQVDDARIQDIARISSLELTGDASGDLVTAVRGRFVAHGRVTMPELGTRLGDDALIQVAFLALTVLAASQMDVGADVASTNYYARLNALLGLTADGSPPGWDTSAFEALWLQLKDELVSQGRGTLAVAPGRNTRRYVWLPVSQSLLPRADIRKLPDFFFRFSLPIYCPTSRDVPDFDSIFLRWARSSSLSTRTKNILTVGSSRRKELLRQVRLALAAWDGSRGTSRHTDEDAARTRTTPIDVRLELSETGAHYYSWLIHRPATFPSQLSAMGGAIEVSTLVATDRDAPYYDPISLPADYDIGAPVSLEANVDSFKYLLVRPSEDVIVFHRDSYLFNSWLSVRRLIHGRDARVACRTSILTEVRTLLRTLCNATNSSGPREASLGDGWHLFKDFRSERVDVDVRDVRLACLIPDSTARLSLVGGIQLRRSGKRHVYLRNYGPSLAEHDSREAVLLNDAPLREAATPLSMLPLGAYELTRGARRLAFSIVDPGISTIPPRVSTFALSGVENASAHVSGAVVDCPMLDDTSWADLAGVQSPEKDRTSLSSAGTYHTAQLGHLRAPKVSSYHRQQLSALLDADSPFPGDSSP